MSVDVGDEAPDFELQDQTYQPVRLSDYRGKKHVVLIFYPVTFSRICGGELCAVRDELPTFQGEEVATLAVSCDSAPVHRAWAEQEGFAFPLLADFWPHGAVAERYGVFDERIGVARRATFIIDRDGVVRHRVVNDIGEARDARAYVEVLESLGVG
jgi:mycoredoxin-dependent peroxiredoxin